MTSLKEKLHLILNEINGKHGDMIAGMIKPQFIDCDEEAMQVTLGFPAMEWEKNPNGVIHGGMMATMIDTAIGITTIAVTETLTPTINLMISYLRPCPADGTIAVKAHITMKGGSVIHTRAEVYDTRSPDELIATAEGAYRLFKTARPYLELM